MSVSEVAIGTLERRFGEDGVIGVSESEGVAWMSVRVRALAGSGGEWLADRVDELGRMGLVCESVEVEDLRLTPQLRRSASWLYREETVVRAVFGIGDCDWEPVRRWALGLADWPWSTG